MQPVCNPGGTLTPSRTTAAVSVAATKSSFSGVSGELLLANVMRKGILVSVSINGRDAL